MLDASRVTLRGIHLVRATLEVNSTFQAPEGGADLIFSPRWAFPHAISRESNKTGFQQHIVLQVWFQDGKTNALLPKEKAPFWLEVGVLGDYEISGETRDDELQEFEVAAAAHCFPFVREAVAELSGRNWHPRVLVPLVNLEVLLKAWREREKSAGTART